MKHLFFDLDRTLWDFERNSEAALRILFDELELGNRVKSFESFHKTYKKINAQLWQAYGTGKLTKEVLRVKRFDDTLKSFQADNRELAEQLADGYVSISPRQTHVFPNTHETLENLKNEGYRMHIITNGFKEVQYIKLENSKLLEYFDVIVCSEEVGKNKPAPEVFHHAMKHAEANPEESVMIGDDYRADILGAERVGMSTILFDPNRKFNERAHDWRIYSLERIPEILPFIAQQRNGIG